ncbi:MAG TPA: helix-turn-helix domain-containing protein [Candidatus Avipropionibacterium avicola]|uniref:HTH-type transcriptional regulator RipA n=1 Tax=Candidatus Avipropionibacterium avicola TaxID=2840701 RepID=A0A9D1GWF5_9ACTN|nr:helix-turn-helix domain-containing protein [Candidatus Avipropionibacterium avicola]
MTSKNFVGAVHHQRAHAPHSHETDQIFWHPSGASELVIAGARWLVSPDAITWLPATMVHAVRMFGSGPSYSAYLDPALRPSGQRWDEPRAVSCGPLLAEVIRHVATTPDLPRERRESCHRLMVSLLQEAPDQLTALALPVHPAARRIAEAVMADPGDRTSLEQWCRRLGVSTRTVIRAFGAETGEGFASWRKRARMVQASRLLAEELTVAEVATRVGYDTASGFIAAFRDATGQTPGLRQRGDRSAG